MRNANCSKDLRFEPVPQTEDTYMAHQLPIPYPLNTPTLPQGKHAGSTQLGMSLRVDRVILQQH